MAPTEKIPSPFRWQFVPAPREKSGEIHWRWRAYSHSGELALESETSFDTLSDCIEDAKSKGYAQP